MPATPKTYYMIRTLATSITIEDTHFIRDFRNAQVKLAYYRTKYPHLQIGVCVFENQKTHKLMRQMFNGKAPLPAAHHVRWAIMPQSHTPKQYIAPHMARAALASDTLKVFEAFNLAPAPYTTNQQTAYFDQDRNMQILTHFIHETMY